ncbi:MAG TPA: DUF222 domain-containing protein [Acidimicrobiia bacterium]
MSAAPVIEAAEPAPPDAVALRLQDTLSWLRSLAYDPAHPDPVGDAQRIDRIAVLERLQSSVEAAKAIEMVAFAKSQTAAQISLGVHPRAIGRGIADQIALACRVSPAEGTRRLHTARDLVLDMPHTFTLLSRGDLSAWTARVITEQVSHLDRPTRTSVDAQLAARRPEGMGTREAAATTKRLASAADPAAAMARAGKARGDRRVTLRAAPDTMSLLTGLLPVEQGVACLAALQAAATQSKADGDLRSKGQIMADTLVARLTGQDTAEDVGVEVGIQLPLGALIDPDDPTPAEIPGWGAIPAGLARELIANAQARSWWRRLFTRPTYDGGQHVVDLDHRRRRFTGWLAELIRWRDWTCRDPYCDAPIRHLDHLHRHHDGGPTTPANGRGVCERGNYVRELPGWTIRLADPDTHTVITTTPTGHQYVSRPPEPP